MVFWDGGVPEGNRQERGGSGVWSEGLSLSSPWPRCWVREERWVWLKVTLGGRGGGRGGHHAVDSPADRSP